MSEKEKVNILLVDDQPAKLLSYEVILGELGENLIKASSGREALEILLRNEIAVILVDVCMPELDGFQLAAMIREHPRFQKTAIIFISAIQMEDVDRLRGYEMGAVDYVPVPVIAAVLQAKVRVFAELYRKTRQLEQLNAELERRVEERTTEIQSMMERQRMLAREVDHRAKNALAVVQSIVRLSRATSIGDFVKAVEGRIHALSIVHTILSETRWRSADLRAIVEQELAPYRGTDKSAQIEITGPPVSLEPTVAQAFALALHELATNAAKYGALSSAAGTLRLAWSVWGDTLTLEWIERGGPEVSPPKERGFGTKVMLASIQQQLGGELRFEWREEGLRCVIVLTRVSTLFGDTASSRAGGFQKGVAGAEQPRSENGGAKTGSRILLVEDEPLVALLMHDILSSAGHRIVGPFSTLAQALEGAANTAVDAAVLDVNLRGEMVFALADYLRKREVPFVFVTGYDSFAIDTRFAGAPVLQKPVDPDALLGALARVGGVAAQLRAVPLPDAEQAAGELRA